MTVPLDRLYNYLESLSDHDIIIYRFYPHGSKNRRFIVSKRLWATRKNSTHTQKTATFINET